MPSPASPNPSPDPGHVSGHGNIIGSSSPGTDGSSLNQKPEQQVEKQDDGFDPATAFTHYDGSLAELSGPNLTHPTDFAGVDPPDAVHTEVPGHTDTSQTSDPLVWENLDHHDGVHPIVDQHLERVPFEAPVHVEKLTAWYEGSFNPLTPAHVILLRSLMDMGFNKIVLGTVPLNPHKPLSSILPLHHRLEMIHRVLDHEGIPRVDNFRSGKTGVCVTQTPFAFHSERLKAWFKGDHRILMGPDNFEAYHTENRAWALFWAKNPLVKRLTRFQTLYDNLLKDRILVYDKHYKLHATDIREGRVELHPAIQDYWREHRLDEHFLK